MGKTYDLLVRARGETKDAERAMKQLQRSVKNAGEGMKSAGASMTKFVTLPVLAAAAASVKLASDAGETASKMKVTFGAASMADINGRLDAFAKATGASRYELREQATTIGALLKPMKLGAKATADMSVDVTKLATDLASFNNVPVDDALASLKSGLTGETEPLKKFGVLMNEAAIKAEGVRMGLVKSGEEMSEQEKVQARYSLIMQQTTDAQSDATRTSGSFANQMKATKNALTDIGVSFGNILLPYAAKLLDKVRDLTSWFQGMSVSSQKFVVVGALIAAVIGPLVFGLGAMVAASSALVPILTAITLPMAAVAVGVVALGAALVIAYTKSERFRDIVNGSFRAVSRGVGQILAGLRQTIGVWIGWATSAWAKWGDEIKSIAGPAFQGVVRVVSVVLADLRDIISAALALLRGDWSEAWGLLKGVVTRTLGLAAQAASGGGRLVVAAIKRLPGALMALAGMFYSAGLGLGKKVVEALVDAVKGAAGRIGDAAKDVAQGALDKITFDVPGIGRSSRGKKGGTGASGVNALGQLFGSNVSIAQVMGYVSASSGQAYSVQQNEDGTSSETANPVVVQFLQERVKANTAALKAKIARRKTVLSTLTTLAAAYNKLKREKAAAARAGKAALAAAKGKSMAANLARRAALRNELDDLNTEIVSLGGQIQSDNEALVPPDVDTTADAASDSSSGAGSGASESSASGASAFASVGGATTGLTQGSIWQPLLPSSQSALGAVGDAAMRALTGSGTVFNITSGDPEAVARRVAFILGNNMTRAGGGF